MPSSASSATPRAVVVLSPHLDDAALSAGGLVHQLTSRGVRVVLATLFTADEPAEAPSETAERLHRLWGGQRVMEARRIEDMEACRVLGAEPAHLELPDALHRQDPDGRARYASLRSLFRAPARSDRHLPAAIALALDTLEPGSLLLAPVAVGGHVDHRHARLGAQLAAAAGRPLALFEDYPYAEGRLALWRAKRGLHAYMVPLEELSIAARCTAIEAYRSQLGPLFGDRETMQRRVRGRISRLGGERLWLANADARHTLDALLGRRSAAAAETRS